MYVLHFSSVQMWAYFGVIRIPAFVILPFGVSSTQAPPDSQTVHRGFVNKKKQKERVQLVSVNVVFHYIIKIKIYGFCKSLCFNPFKFTSSNIMVSLIYLSVP